MSDATIAEIVRTVRAGRFVQVVDDRLHRLMLNQVVGVPSTPVIDASSVFHDYMARESFSVYEDHPCIRPPWTHAWVGYKNGHGNINVALVVDIANRPDWETENDTSTAIGFLAVFVFCGGRCDGGKKAIPTFGPINHYRIAYDKDGAPLDVNWVRLTRTKGLEALNEENFDLDWPLWMVLGTYTLLNCSNITLVENRPTDRASRRRQDRLGIIESTIHIRPNATRRHSAGSADGEPVRLHSVRGHVSHYGACCGDSHPARGLLFGRITGRVWVPQHARGINEIGETKQTFVVHAREMVS